MASRFPPPSTKILHISKGDTLTVKARLNSGESRAAFARMAIELPDGTLKIDPLKRGLGICAAYLVDWSLTDPSGEVVPIRGASFDDIIAALDRLDPESFIEVKDAIEAHDVSILAARTAEKNDHDGASESSAISPSPDAVTGDMNGSAS